MIAHTNLYWENVILFGDKSLVTECYILLRYLVLGELDRVRL